MKAIALNAILGVVGGAILAGYLVGFLANKVYENLTDETRRASS